MRDPDSLFVSIARQVATRGTCSRAQVGALIVRDQRIVSMGYNGAPPGQPHCEHSRKDVGGCTRATHAEANAIAYAARHGISCDLASMYCTHSMCATCAALVVAAGIIEVVYSKPYRLTEGLELLDKCNVRVRQYGVE